MIFILCIHPQYLPVFAGHVTQLAQDFVLRQGDNKTNTDQQKTGRDIGAFHGNRRG